MIFAAVLPLFHHALSLRQQKTASQQQKERAAKQHRNPHPGHIEDAKGLHAPFLDKAIHHQIGAGANQGTGTAENGRITERQQQLGRRQTQALCPLLHRRDHHCDHCGVIQKGTQQGRRGDQAQLARKYGFRLPQQPVRDPVNSARIAQGRRHHIQGGDGHQPRVGKA